MPEVIAPYALTTVARVKDRLAITSAGNDTNLLRIISAATDIMERYCNRRFKSTSYTNEVYNVRGQGALYVFTKQTPVSAISSFQYRAGTPSTPSWTSFLADNYELEGDGASGIIRVYGGLSTGSNQVRISYTAGYLIDFANAGSATHTLPFDLTDACERLTTKIFKKRDAEGRTQESFEGGNISWGSLMDDDMKQVLNRYKRDPLF